MHESWWYNPRWQYTLPVFLPSCVSPFAVEVLTASLPAFPASAMPRLVLHTAVSVKQTMALSGKVALVTGATGGIGGAITEKLAILGCQVFACSRKVAVLEKVSIQSCRAFGGVGFT